jgi:hypothetical protein
MTFVRLGAALAAAAALAAPAPAQEFAKPGPEHEQLKKMEGKWDLVMKAGGVESKGTATYKMELGGLWLVSDLDCDLGGAKFQGKGLDTYDAAKKVYRSVWVDSMAPGVMIMEGSYDKGKKALTMTGEGPAPDGKTAKWKSVSTMPDKDTLNFEMYVGDAKEPMFTIVYKRKK